MVEATIEDVAFMNRSSRAAIWGHPYIVGEAVLSTTLPKDLRSGQTREQSLDWQRGELTRAVPSRQEEW